MVDQTPPPSTPPPSGGYGGAGSSLMHSNYGIGFSPIFRRKLALKHAICVKLRANTLENSSAEDYLLCTLFCKIVDALAASMDYG
jgi:hypothetical protein